MDDTLSSNCLFGYSPHLCVDLSVISSGLSGSLGSAGCVLKFAWQFVIRESSFRTKQFFITVTFDVSIDLVNVFFIHDT